jgi:hypothetical protein
LGVLLAWVDWTTRACDALCPGLGESQRARQAVRRLPKGRKPECLGQHSDSSPTRQWFWGPICEASTTNGPQSHLAVLGLHPAQQRLLALDEGRTAPVRYLLVCSRIGCSRKREPRTAFPRSFSRRGSCRPMRVLRDVGHDGLRRCWPAESASHDHVWRGDWPPERPLSALAPRQG